MRVFPKRYPVVSMLVGGDTDVGMETTQSFFGLGNASVAPPGTDPERDFYGRGHPTLSLRLRWALTPRFSIEAGQLYTENWFDLPETGTLATKMSAGTPTEQRLLGRVRSLLAMGSITSCDCGKAQS